MLNTESIEHLSRLLGAHQESSVSDGIFEADGVERSQEERENVKYRHFLYILVISGVFEFAGARCDYNEPLSPAIQIFGVDCASFDSSFICFRFKFSEAGLCSANSCHNY